MSAEFQMIVNVAFGVGYVLIGWILNVLWTALTDLRKADEKLVDRVGNVEVLVAGKYVTNERLDHLSSALFKKLDSIAEKIDKKMDK